MILCSSGNCKKEIGIGYMPYRLKPCLVIREGNAIEALQEPERMKGRWEEFDYDNSYRCTACGEI